MRRLMTGFRNVPFNGVFARYRLTSRRITSLVAVAGIVCLAPAYAKDPVEKEGKSLGKGAIVVPQAESESGAIPHCLEKLTLTPKQQDQIKKIVGEYDESLGIVWKQFSDRYMQSIKMESSLLAAVEDNLTEPQRKQVRVQRTKTAQHGKRHDSPKDPSEKSEKHESSAEEELANAGVTLTAEQEAAADKVHEKYRSQLRSMHRDIHGLHDRLISLEASKMTAIEMVLTKDQLTQLRSSRQDAPASAVVEVSKIDSKKTE